jgi:hypothetical protein
VLAEVILAAILIVIVLTVVALSGRKHVPVQPFYGWGAVSSFRVAPTHTLTLIVISETTIIGVVGSRLIWGLSLLVQRFVLRLGKKVIAVVLVLLYELPILDHSAPNLMPRWLVRRMNDERDCLRSSLFVVCQLGTGWQSLPLSAAR